jgi:hypothetical protein
LEVKQKRRRSLKQKAGRRRSFEVLVKYSSRYRVSRRAISDAGRAVYCRRRALNQTVTHGEKFRRATRFRDFHGLFPLQ